MAEAIRLRVAPDPMTWEDARAIARDPTKYTTSGLMRAIARLKPADLNKIDREYRQAITQELLSRQVAPMHSISKTYPVPPVPVAIKRRQPKWRPTWEGSAYQRYAEKWTAKNFWRVATLFLEQADAMQECGLVFARCVDRYINHPQKGRKDGFKEVDNPAWFMSLFKTALYYRWIRLQWDDEAVRSIEVAESLEDTAQRIAGHDSSEPVEDVASTLNSQYVQHGEGAFMAALRASPLEVQTVVRRLITAPQETIDWLFGGRTEQETLHSTDQDRDAINRRLRRWCGVATYKGDLIEDIANLVS